MGYTKHSKRFDRSFSDDVEASRAVVKLIEPYQERARERYGETRFQLSDEFYVDADLPVPPAETYDGYPQFYDGIGMLRSFLDESALVRSERAGECVALNDVLGERDLKVMLVCGEAAEKTISVFCSLVSPEGRIFTRSIRNDYYGGDVNVTGLIVSCDLLAQIPEDLASAVVVLPEVMFNFDHVTLDGDTQEHILEELRRRGAMPLISEPSPGKLLDCLVDSLIPS